MGDAGGLKAGARCQVRGVRCHQEQVRRRFRACVREGDAAAAVEGYNASVRGLPVERCPYDEAWERTAWMKGWEMSDAVGIQMRIPEQRERRVAA